MRTVEDHLVAGVSMDCRHDTALNGSIVVKSLSHGSKAVCGAGSSGNDFVLFVKSLFVNAVNDCLEVIACRSGNNDLLSACVNMSLSLILRSIEARALKNYVNADLAPRKILSVFHSIDSNLFAVYGNGVFAGLNGVSFFTDLAAVTALSGIVLEKVSEHLGIGKIVDGNYLIALCAEHLSERKTADTTETVNSNFN